MEVRTTKEWVWRGRLGRTCVLQGMVSCVGMLLISQKNTKTWQLTGHL